MHTSNFQTGLICALSLGLGYGLSSSEAEGYPAGTTVSAASNPIRSVAGDFSLGDSTSRVTLSDFMSSPADQDLVLTDVMLGLTTWAGVSCSAAGKVQIRDSEGKTYGEFVVALSHLDSIPWPSTTYESQSGIRIPAGKTLELVWDWHYRACGETYYEMVYTLSGYLAQP